jgi:hypothetical protein
LKEGEGDAAKDTNINIVTLKEEAGFSTLEEYNKSLEAPAAEPVATAEVPATVPAEGEAVAKTDEMMAM